MKFKTNSIVRNYINIIISLDASRLRMMRMLFGRLDAKLMYVPVKCPTCAAAAAFDNDTRTVSCDYCGSSSVLPELVTDKPTAEKYAKLALRAIKKGKYGKAIELCETGLAIPTPAN